MEVKNSSLNNLNPISFHWKSAIAGSISAASTITAIALKAFNPLNLGKNYITGTFLSLIAGAGFQNTIQVLLPKKWAEKEKAFLANYATAIFLIISQVYRNIIPTSEDKEWVFAGLTGLGGTMLAAFVHTLFTRKIDQLIRGLPLDIKNFYQSEDSSENEEEKTDIQKKNFTMVGFNSSRSRLVFNLVKGIFALTAVTIGATVGTGSLLRDFGIILAGDSVMQIANEFCIVWFKPLQQKQNISSPLLGKSSHLQRYQLFMKVFLVLARVLPGMMIVFGRFNEKIRRPALSILAYLFTGILDGGKRHFELIRYTQVPIKHLKELKRNSQIGEGEKQPLINKLLASQVNKLEKIGSIAKWIFAIFGIGGFLVLTEAGLNPQTGKFTSVPPFDRVAIATFAAFLYGGYAIAQLVKYRFRKNKLGESSSWINSAFFYLHYSQGIPLLALYIMEKMEIGDEALAKDPVLQGILGCIAYASLGAGLSFEANARGEFSQPSASIPSSLTMALIFRFIAHELTNQV